MDMGGIHAWMEGAMREMQGDYSMYHRDPLPLDDLGLKFSDEEAEENTETSSEDDEDEHVDNIGSKSKSSSTPLPMWYLNQPFQYDGRISLVSLPGLLMTLSIGGDLLLSEVTFGGLLVYLFIVAGEENKSSVAFLITFFICHCTLIYSAFPLIWTSVYHVSLLFTLNAFMVITGGWLFLHFQYLRQREPRLVKVFETLLFAVYPSVNVMLLTWLVTAFTTTKIAPYCLLITGFVVLQFFLTPTPSSFVKKNVELPPTVSGDILEAVFVGVTSLLYVVLSPLVFLFVQASSDRYHGFLMFLEISWVEFLFIVSLSICLATFMNVRQFLEEEGISLRRLIHVRWISGLLALLLLSGVLHGYGFTIYLLPWLSVGVAIHAAYGIMVRRRGNKMFGLLGGAGLTGFYLMVFTKLPWSMQYYLLSDLLHVSHANLLLLASALLCVVCVYASVYCSRELLGFLVLMQSFVLVISEKLLLASSIYTTSGLLVSMALGVYFTFRFYHVGKLPWQHAWISVALHLSKLGDLPKHLVPHIKVTSSSDEAAFAQMALLALSLLLTQVLGFLQRDKMSFNKWLFYIWITGCVVSVNTPFFLVELYWLVVGVPPTLPQLMGLGLTVAGGVSAKLSLSHPEAWIGARTLSITLLTLAFGVVHLEPGLSGEWSDVSRWLFLVVLMGVLLITPIASYTRHTPLLCAFGQILGFPLGFILATWMFQDTSPHLLLSCTLYGVILGFCADMALLSWRQVKNVEQNILILFGLTLPCCLILLALEWTEESSPELNLGSNLDKVTGVITLVAIILKGLSFRDKDADITKSGEVTYSPLVYIGNMCTLLSFLLLCAVQPITAWEIWYLGSSSILLCLQRDQYLLQKLSRKNYYAPVLYVLSLVIWKSAYNSSMYWTSTYFWPIVGGMAELAILFLVIPIFFIFFTVLWSDLFFVSDRLVVFLSPLCLFLFFHGNTQAWIFATYTLTVCLWLVKYKLPLHVERYQ